jgi:hypothetical protein
MTEPLNKDLDANAVINELSLQIANYARDNAILKSIIKSLQEQLTAMGSKR